MVFRRIKLKSAVVKRAVAIAGHKTSISVEDAFWKGLKEIAADRNMTLSDLVTTINSKREDNNLSSVRSNDIPSAKGKIRAMADQS